MSSLRIFAVIACCMGSMVAVGQNAPDFTVTDSHGVTHHLYADYLNHGKTVLIKIFFTTCPPCNAIAPYMQPLYEDWGAGDYDVEFFELSDKNFDTNTLVNGYETNYGQTFPAAGVEGGSLAAVQPYEQGQFGPFYGTPTFIVVAPDGSMQYDIRGLNNAETIAMVNAAIAATGAMPPSCTVTETVNDNICEGDGVWINGVWYDQPGMYTDQIEGGSCDTILSITITQTPLNEKTVNTSFCPGDGVWVYGTYYDAPGTYTDTVGAEIGCDTVVTIGVTMDPLNTKSVNASFPEGDSVYVYGMWYSAAGTFNVQVPSTTGGCDTLVTLHIMEIPDNTNSDVTVNGIVRTYTGKGIGQAIVTIWLGGQEIARDTTDNMGRYAFTMDSNFIVTNELHILVNKYINPLNGVSVLDIVAMQKHELGLQLLDRTDKLFAADVNNTQSISVLDLVYLRRLLLGYENVFPTGESWLFFNEAVDLGPPGPQPPVIVQEDPILLGNVYHGTQSGNFRGLKLADLNDTADPTK